MQAPHPAAFLQERICQDQRKILKSRRRSKRADVKQSFECSCGNIYLSFSALYLHARNKHDIKLSSRPTSLQCLIKSQPGLTKFMYIVKLDAILESKIEKISPVNYNLSAKRQKNEAQGSLHKIGVLKQNLLGKYYEKHGSKQKINIIRRFLALVLDNYQGTQQSQQNLLQNSPYKLNEFVLSILPREQNISINSPEWQSACQSLNSFCQWLKLNNYTDLLVVCDL